MTKSPTTKKAHRAEVYRKAARIIERDAYIEYSCEAIGMAARLPGGWVNLDGPDAVDWPEMELLRPRDTAACGGWWFYTDRGSRIIGLCLAAAIAERP